MHAKAYKGMGMEGPIAAWYAALTRKDMPGFAALARRMASDLADGAHILDLASGPGYFGIELAKLGRHRITGLDISASFVRIARRNAAAAGVEVDFREGNAAAMPFQAETFDLLFCRAAFKNFSQPAPVLAEMHRVLKPGGRAVIIDLRADASGEDIDAQVDGMGLNAINRNVTRRILRWLRNRAYTQADFRRLIEASAFRRFTIAPTATGVEIGLVK